MSAVNYIICGLLLFTNIAYAVAAVKNRTKKTRGLEILYIGMIIISILITANRCVDTQKAKDITLYLFRAILSVLLLVSFWHSAMFNDYIENRRVQIAFPILAIVTFFEIIGTSYCEIYRELGYFKYVHIAFCVCMVSSIIAMYVCRARTLPKLYRIPYYNVYNAFILFSLFIYILIKVAPGYGYEMALLVYTAYGCLMYWNFFSYFRGTSMDAIRKLIFQEIDSPVVMFDRNDEVIMVNNKAVHLINRLRGRDKLSDDVSDLKMMDILDRCQGDIDKSFLKEDDIFFLSFEYKGLLYEYKIMYKVYNDENDLLIGRYLMFISDTESKDNLTGFYTRESFVRVCEYEARDWTYPVSVVIFDINRLGRINAKFGEDTGDRAIQDLAVAMIKEFPKQTYFVRTGDANLVAVCSDMDEATANTHASNVKNAIFEKRNVPEKITVQNAVYEVTNSSQDIVEALRFAYLTMRKKKMLDVNSENSGPLEVMIQLQMFSDKDLASHINRTRMLCGLISDKLKLSDMDRCNLEILCIVHDIGKLGIDNKVGQDVEEISVAQWEELKKHVEYGYNIAASSKEFEGIAYSILHHHESYDGSGYPDGLKGESIPYLARILAVVEAYDAMTNDRPYRKAYSPLAARNELKKYSGKQFDPEIVDSFIDMLETNAPADIEQEKYLERLDNARKPMSISIDAETEDVIKNVKYTRYFVDDTFTIVDVDDSFAIVTGYTRTMVAERNLSQLDLIFEEERANYLSIVEENKKKSPVLYYEHRLRRADGRGLFVFCYGRRFFDQDKNEYISEIIVSDITSSSSEARQSERIRIGNVNVNDYERDSLTGIISSTAFESNVKKVVGKNMGKGLLVTMTVDEADSSEIKTQDEASDIMLKKLADFVMQAVDRTGLVGRTARNEISVFYNMNENSDDGRALDKVTELWGTVMTLMKGAGIKETITAGAAVQNDELHSFKDLIEAARRASRDGQQSGGKCYKLYGK